MIMITVLVNIRLSMAMMIAVSRLSRSLVITSITISLNSLGTSVIVAYARGITISRFSRSLMITISLNTLGTSVVIADSGTVTISRLSRSLAIISFGKSLSSSVDMAVSSISISRLSSSRSLLIIVINLISIRSVIMIAVLVDIRLSMSISWFS